VPDLVTLTSDFGTDGAYVAAMKGVIAGIAPDARVVDVTHGVEPQDVMEAAWILRQSVPFFPAGAIHLAVVDPGVGTARRAVACRIGEHFFVGPDNGLFSLLLGPDVLGPADPDELVVLDRPTFWRTPSPCATFHGRDIFAPAAAHLANGCPLDEVGSPVPPESLVRLRWVLPRADDQGVQGWIVHIDRFGNAITNIPSDLVDQHSAGRSIRCYAGSTILEGVRTTYAEVDEGESLVLTGSSGHLEVSIRGGDAAGLLSLSRGTAVHLVFVDRR
jgi:S-adenosyl-L-methionine hydrolase (adenosine-forming)